MKWKYIILPALTLLLIFTTTSTPEENPTKALLAKRFIPTKIDWEEIRVVEDENGSSETGSLNDPIVIERGLVYGVKLDSLDGVYVYHNKGEGKRGKRRHKAKDGYNLGLRWQCVEFVKRYYYEHYNHKMPKDRGHAKTFYKKGLKDGEFNKERGLYQFALVSDFKPVVGEIIIFKNGGYGHVAIISKALSDRIEIIEQNASVTRREFLLERTSAGKWIIKKRNNSEYVLGRLGLAKNDFFSNFEETNKNYDISRENGVSEKHRSDTLASGWSE